MLRTQSRIRVLISAGQRPCKAVIHQFQGQVRTVFIARFAPITGEVVTYGIDGEQRRPTTVL
jgi:hypothetical protein